MKKVLLLLALISVTAFGYTKMLIGIEGGAGYLIANDDNFYLDHHNYFFVNGSVLINVHNNFYIRTELAKVSFLSGDMILTAGTMSPIDAMMFFESQTFNPYALGGVSFTTGNGTTVGVRAGGGLEFKLNDSRFFPFAEAIVDLQSMSSHTDYTITIKGGVRVR